MKTNRIHATKGMLAATFAAIAAPTFAAAANMPPEHRLGPVAYVSGGIGETEAKRFEREMPRHALAIEVLEHSGRVEEFTADAGIRVADRHGRTVLDTIADGPFVLVDLPPGRYTVIARLRNRTLRKSPVFITRDQLARATFEFPENTD